MKQKKLFRQALSGALTLVTLFTTVLSPLSAMAEEVKPEDDLTAYVETLPTMEEVADRLDPAERVNAEDCSVEIGSKIDLKTDFTNIRYDGEKVKVSFYEAKNAEGQDFSTSHADSYKATYYAEPYSGNPAYRFSRMVSVTEPISPEADEIPDSPGEETAEPSESESGDEDPDADLPAESTGETEEQVDLPSPDDEQNTEGTITEPTNTEPVIEEPVGTAADLDEPASEQLEKTASGDEQPVEDDPGLSREEMNKLLEEAKDQEMTDWETGMTVSGVLVWASEKERINLLGLDSGETVSFDMPTLRGAARGSSTECVSITRGEYFYYENYGLGTYVTSPYFIQFGNVSTIAFCVQPALPGPGDGVYTIEQVWDNADLAKVIYYAAYTSGSENFFDSYYPYYDQTVRFIITRIAASYANGSEDAFTGANETAQELAMQLYYFAVNQPEIPDMTMSFSNPSVTAYKDGDGQRTENVTFYADSSQSMVMNLPDGVVFHNVTTGATSAPGASVTVYGGTTFFLTAPMSQTGDSSGSWSSTMHGSISEDYAAYKITTGWDVQDLAFVFGETSQHEQSVSFRVTWLSNSRILVTKRDSASGENLAGAVFGVYADAACTSLIAQMPATDADGRSLVELTAAQDTVYLKEITPPKGYACNTSAISVNVVPGQYSMVTISNDKILGGLTIYKEGKVLTGATVTEDEVVFQYETQRLPGASFRVTAGEDIVGADGTAIYREGDVVAENLTTGGRQV